MNIWELYHPAFDCVSKKYGFNQLASPYSEGSFRWFNESVGHELAHQVVLGHELSSRGMSTFITRLPDKEADNQELWALATELSAFKEIGLQVNHRLLCYWSAEMMRQPFMKVPVEVHRSVRCLLGTDSIERWKNAFLYEIRCAVEESEKLQKERDKNQVAPNI